MEATGGRKNVLLKECFDNYMNKIFCLSGKSQWYSDTLVSWVLAIQLCGRKIYMWNLLATDNVASNF